MAFNFSNNKAFSSIEPEYNPCIGLIQYTIVFIHNSKIPKDPWPDKIYDELVQLKEQTLYKRLKGVFNIDVTDQPKQSLIITTSSLETLKTVVSFIYKHAKHIKVHCLIHSIETTIDFNVGPSSEPYTIDEVDISGNVILPATKQLISINKLCCNSLRLPAYYADNIVFNNCDASTDGLMRIYTQTSTLTKYVCPHLTFIGKKFEFVHGIKNNYMET